MSKIILIMLTISTYAFASSVEQSGTDIVQRTVNFFLFAGLIWYLIAEPVKNYFVSRSNSISDELNKVQDKLNESITLKKDAQIKILEAKQFAEELETISLKENDLLVQKIMKQCDQDIINLEKQNVSSMKFEQRNMIRNVVDSILNDVLTQSDNEFDRSAMTNIILKKVA